MKSNEASGKKQPTTDNRTDRQTALATDGGIPTPTQTGYRILWVLAGQSRTPEALRSEVNASFDCEVSLQSIRRTCRSLAESDLARATGRDDGTRQFVITARGRHVAYGELAGALDHADLSSAMKTVGRRIATGETEDALPPRKTTLQGSRPADMPFGTPDSEDADDDVRTDGGSACAECGAELPEEIDSGTGVYCPDCGHGQLVTDGGRDVATPTHDTPLTYQMRCGSCANLIGMSARYCSRCGTKVDHADGNEGDATRKLLTGGDR